MTSLFDLPVYSGSMPESMFADVGRRCGSSVAALDFLALDAEPGSEKAADAVGNTLQEAIPDDRALQIAAMIDAAREDAGAQARLEMEVECEIQQQRERARAEHLTVEFARDRRRYFAAAEGQIVKLAIAMAERILAREIAVDALPLASAVRAALARVQDGSETVLRVRPEQADEWRAIFADEPRIGITEDARLEADDCILETRIGRIDLGVNTQLEEIERGFDDLLTRTGD